MKISHHKTWTSAKAKLARLRATDPENTYYHVVNEDAPFMPHEVCFAEGRNADVPRSWVDAQTCA